MSCERFYPLLVQPGPLRNDRDLVQHLARCEDCRESHALLRNADLDGQRPPSGSLAPGDVVESYCIERLLGAGGMGEVFAAVHAVIPRRVAIKVMRRELLASPDLVARFRQDALLVAQLRGDHVCRLTSFGHLADGRPYMVLEYLDGEDLATIVEREQQLPADMIVELMLQACEGLAEAHARNIVHRDVKPANLFIVANPDRSPKIKLLDFGIAKLRTTDVVELLTRTGVRIGSLPYMAPEQLRSSRSVDARADIWSLGATMYHLASGRLPFTTNGSGAETAIKIWADEPPPLRGVADGFAAIVSRCLSKPAADRYGNVAELAQDLATLGGPPARGSAQRVARILGGAFAL